MTHSTAVALPEGAMLYVVSDNSWGMTPLIRRHVTCISSLRSVRNSACFTRCDCWHDVRPWPVCEGVINYAMPCKMLIFVLKQLDSWRSKARKHSERCLTSSPPVVSFSIATDDDDVWSRFWPTFRMTQRQTTDTDALAWRCNFKSRLRWTLHVTLQQAKGTDEIAYRKQPGLINWCSAQITSWHWTGSSQLFCWRCAESVGENKHNRCTLQVHAFLMYVAVRTWPSHHLFVQLDHFLILFGVCVVDIPLCSLLCFLISFLFHVDTFSGGFAGWTKVELFPLLERCSYRSPVSGELLPSSVWRLSRLMAFCSNAYDWR